MTWKNVNNFRPEIPLPAGILIFFVTAFSNKKHVKYAVVND